MAIRPTKKQQELLQFIDNFITGFGPSYREIMRGLGYKSVSTVATHIDNLVARGHLRKRGRSARSLEIVRQEDQTDNSGHKAWLINLVKDRFTAAESLGAITTETMDDLYVLAAALKLLGFTAESRRFIKRADELRERQQPSRRAITGDTSEVD